MRKDIFLYIIGLLVFLIPFLGVPEAWKTNALFVLGASIVLGAFACRMTIRRLERNEHEYFYEENTPNEGPDVTSVGNHNYQEEGVYEGQ